MQPQVRQPGKILFVSHGGGPLPLLGDSAHAELVQALQAAAQTLPRPDQIVVISAHWEAPVATITSAAKPTLIYDYYGFPPAAYQVAYPAAGSPQLAGRLAARLTAAGITSREDAQRGFDHGMFVPLKLMWPEADIPCVQLSLLDNLSAAAHIAMGKALRELLQENTLILGSGFSFHNLPAFFGKPTPQGQSDNQAFEQWLSQTCTRTDISEDQREQLLMNWESAPGARYCHPREEHLLPVHVCYGAAGKAASDYQQLSVLGKQAGLISWL